MAFGDRFRRKEVGTFHIVDPRGGGATRAAQSMVSIVGEAGAEKNGSAAHRSNLQQNANAKNGPGKVQAGMEGFFRGHWQ